MLRLPVLRVAICRLEWKTEIRQVGDAIFLENDENNALRFSHVSAVDFETLK